MYFCIKKLTNLTIYATGTLVRCVRYQQSVYLRSIK